MEPMIPEEWFSFDRFVHSLRQSRIQRRVAIALAAMWPSFIGASLATAWAISQCLESQVAAREVYFALLYSAVFVGAGLTASLYAVAYAPWKHRWHALVALLLLSVQTWALAGIAWEPTTLRLRMDRASQISATLLGLHDASDAASNGEPQPSGGDSPCVSNCPSMVGAAPPSV